MVNATVLHRWTSLHTIFCVLDYVHLSLIDLAIFLSMLTKYPNPRDQIGENPLVAYNASAWGILQLSLRTVCKMLSPNVNSRSRGLLMDQRFHESTGRITDEQSTSQQFLFSVKFEASSYNSQGCRPQQLLKARV